MATANAPTKGTVVTDADRDKWFRARTGARHTYIVGGPETIRIRVLDRFGKPHRKTKCEVDVPGLGKSEAISDDKGWLEIHCPESAEYVDLALDGVTDCTKRHVLLKPTADDAQGTKQRLANLGFCGHEGEEDQRCFRRAHGLDPEADLQARLDEIESNYKQLDDPSEQDAKDLDQQTHDLKEQGERT